MKFTFFYLSYRLWSTYDPDLIKLFHAIYLDDIEQVQTCLEQNHVKCHPLCHCDLCSTGDKLLMSKDDLRFWTPLSLACWLGEYKNNYRTLANKDLFETKRSLFISIFDIQPELLMAISTTYFC